VNTLEQTIGNTPLVKLQRLGPDNGSEIWVKLEGNNPAGSVKDRAALSMIVEAEKRGEIKPGDVLIEATSGNTGIALAMIAALKGYQMKLLMPDNMSQERRAAMRAYGAELILVTKQQGMEGARDLALDMAQRGEGKLLDQFNNPDNPYAHYTTTGPEIWRQTEGRISHFVSSMGTTGTITGVSRFLREQEKAVTIVGLQPEEGSSIPGIRRWPAEYMPGIFNASLVDQVLDIHQNDAENTMRALAVKEGVFCGVSSGGAVAGALWLVAEGGLSPELSRAVWAGFRRPRGNLVAQSLAAHGGSPLAATLRGLRVSRIAVHPTRQREGLGRKMIADIAADAAGYDYLSVSFGYTAELWRFWQRCGFTLVRLGTHREASSGCYTAMALYPLTAAGRQLAQREAQRLQRDEYWLRPWREESAPLPAVADAMLSDEDWLEAASFAFAHRPLAAALGCLNRLLMQADMPLPALRGRLQGKEEAALCAVLQLTGRKALQARWRREAADALRSLDAARADALRQQVAHLQFF